LTTTATTSSCTEEVAPIEFHIHVLGLGSDWQFHSCCRELGFELRYCQLLGIKKLGWVHLALVVIGVDDGGTAAFKTMRGRKKGAKKTEKQTSAANLQSSC